VRAQSLAVRVRKGDGEEEKRIYLKKNSNAHELLFWQYQRTAVQRQHPTEGKVLVTIREQMEEPWSVVRLLRWLWRWQCNFSGTF